MTWRPALFVELFAGTAALSLALQAGARPPVSRIGAKTGYSRVLLGLLGLRPGQGADAYLWVEPDAGMASVLRCYPDPVALRAVAERIRSWKDEEPRALWERLRAEGRAVKGEDAAGWVYLSGHCYRKGEIESGWQGVDTSKDEGCRDLKESQAITLDSISSLRFPPVRVVEGRAESVDVGEVARWLYVVGQSVQKTGLDRTSWFTRPTGDGQKGCDGYADDIESMITDWPPCAVLNGKAETVEVNTLPPGVVVYMDPPYQKTTGYANDCDRATVLDLARRWDSAGATVLISEAEPLDLPGWRHVEITGERRGQKRTFGGTHEWVTMNRDPVIAPSHQVSLFGGDIEHETGRRS